MWKLIGMALVVVMAAGGGVVLLSENRRLNGQLRQANALFNKLQEEIRRVEAEKAQIDRAYEALQNDVVSSVARNTTLQEEAEQLRTRVAETERLLHAKESELQQAHGTLEKLQEMARAKHKKNEKLTNDIDAFTQQVASLEAGLKQERVLCRSKLGAVYAQVQRYDQAIEAYQQALALDPEYADAHYNLGQLYERVTGQADQAAGHYRRYLELKPHAEDRDEVQEWIERLTAHTP